METVKGYDVARKMYDDLIKSLRVCGRMESIDDNCIAYHDRCCEAEPLCMYELMRQAADSIEEMQKTIDALCEENTLLRSDLDEMRNIYIAEHDAMRN